MENIEHSLSAIYNIPHGAGLAIVIAAWLKYFHKEKSSLIAKFGRNVFAIKEVNDMEAAGKGIELLEKWFEKIGAPTRLGDVHIPEKDIKDIAENALKLAELWQLHDYNLQVIADILSLAV